MNYIKLTCLISISLIIVNLLGLNTSTELQNNAENITKALQQAITTTFNDISNTDNVVAVVYFTTSDESITDFLLNETQNLLVNSKYKTVEQNSLLEARKTELKDLKAVDDESAVRVGNITGADVVLVGSIDGMGVMQRLRLKAISTQDGTQIGSASEPITQVANPYATNVNINVGQSNVPHITPNDQPIFPEDRLHVNLGYEIPFITNDSNDSADSKMGLNLSVSYVNDRIIPVVRFEPGVKFRYLPLEFDAITQKDEIDPFYLQIFTKFGKHMELSKFDLVPYVSVGYDILLNDGSNDTQKAYFKSLDSFATGQLGVEFIFLKQVTVDIEFNLGVSNMITSGDHKLNSLGFNLGWMF